MMPRRLLTGRLLAVLLGLVLSVALAGPASAAPATITTTVGTVTSTSVVLAWDYTWPSGTDPVPTALRVGRDGTDSRGTGPWSTTSSTVADGSRTFPNLVTGRTYTLYVELLRNGVVLARSSRTVTPGGTTTTPPPPPPSGSVVPVGVPGSWVQTFGDEFSGTAIDPVKWYVHNGKIMNNVTTRPGNVTVANGEARLQLSDSSTGAMLTTDTVDGVGKPDGYELPVGSVTEARVWFPGNGTNLYNWPAWWANADPWACGGEHDIAEALGENGGVLTVNYHHGCYPNVVHDNQRPNPAGYWGGAWHTFALHRAAGTAYVYWDGRLVHDYPTPDNRDGESLILNVGRGAGPTVLGAAGAMRVDYVRAWRAA